MIDSFLSNNTSKTFLQKIKQSLQECNSFCFSVSFIKKAGLVLIEKEIESCLEKGSIGKIIVSTYQNFTDIASLRTFLNWSKKYNNFECHLDIECFGENGFHTKGYIFDKPTGKELVVGSSNITRFALLKNIEWNISLSSDGDFNSLNDATKEFETLWNKTLSLNEDLIEKYQVMLDYAIEKWDMDYYVSDLNIIKPNTMQRKALKEIQRYRDMGVNKALVVSATASGKTYLAAFDARNFDAKRVLFVVHRDKILSDAKDTFFKVFGPDKTYGLYVGKNKELDADFVFASNIMLYNHLNDFSPTEFDYIVMDECHHATASTYKQIIEYFKPGFMLGLTATPERMDNQDVFELFDKNVPYELRLRDAILNDLVVPFHYYGIRDQLADYSYVDASKVAKEIANPKNVRFIVSEIEKHRPEGKIKALAFCSCIDHARLMAEQLENYGYHTIALTGKNDLGQRIKAFNDLQSDSNPLEIICTVDILNEGVDIPQVNMVLFLRPTESSTIFIQQLGRGLRKYEGKTFTTVLDFIGNNYNRSIQIAMALGSLGKNTIIEKQYLIDLIRNNFVELRIPGVEINIDQLSKEEIIDYIKNENFNKKAFLQKDYENFKIYLKKETYPSHMDYLNNDCAPDLLRFMKSKIDGKKNVSYYNFLSKMGESSLPIFTDKQKELIDNISNLVPVVRLDEMLILKQLLNEGTYNLTELSEYDCNVKIETLEHSIKMLIKENIININKEFVVDSINNELKEYLNDLIDYSIERYRIEFGDFEGKFSLYNNYYKEQIMRVSLEENLPFQKGTKFYDDGTTYLFVGLKKDKEKQERSNYKDKFLSSDVFQWESENNTTTDNSTGRKLLNTKIVHLFVRKMDEEDGITLPFTYFGTGKLINMRKESVPYLQNDGKTVDSPTLLFDVVLDNKVPVEYWFDFEVPSDKEIKV